MQLGARESRMLFLTVLLAGSAAAAQVTARSTPTPTPSAQSLPPPKGLIANEVLKDMVSIPGVGQFRALEVTGLPPRPKSGQATGERQHAPRRLKVFFDIITNRAAVKAALQVGRSFPSMRIKGATLKNVRVESIQSAPEPKGSRSSPVDSRPVEWISFTYEQIEWN